MGNVIAQLPLDRLAGVLDTAYGLTLARAEPIDFGIWEESCSVWAELSRLHVKRFWRRDRRRDVMLHGLELSQLLRRQGIPAPEVVRTLTGDLLATVDGETYQVTTWVDGCCYHPGNLPLVSARGM